MQGGLCVNTVKHLILFISLLYIFEYLGLILSSHFHLFFLMIGDRNELMKERMKLEKAKKSGQKQTEIHEVSTAQQKRKQPEDETDSGKKKEKSKEADREWGG